MSMADIKRDDSLETIWGILVWEEARMIKDKDAADLAPDASALLTQWELVDAGQRAAWRAEIIADAGVASCNDQLDDTVVEVDAELFRIFKSRNKSRYTRYFKKPRNEVVRLRLEKELKEVRTWPGSLQTEPEPALQALGQRLEADVNAGDAAITERADAAASRADHRVRAIEAFVDAANAARRTRYGILVQRAVDRGLPKDWPQRFFKKSSSSQAKAAKARAEKAQPAAASAANGEAAAAR